MEIKQVKRGNYIKYEGKPYLVRDLQSVVISRHSGTKIKVELEGVLEKSKKLLTLSPHEEIEKIEIIRKHGQILSISGSIAQVMSMDDYRTFDACVQEELLKEIKEGDEVTYVEFEGVANVVEIRK